MAKLIVNGEVVSGSTNYASAISCIDENGTQSTVQDMFDKVKPISKGGTGATTAAAALTNLGAASASSLSNLQNTVNSHINNFKWCGLINNIAGTMQQMPANSVAYGLSWACAEDAWDRDSSDTNHIYHLMKSDNSGYFHGAIVYTTEDVFFANYGISKNELVWRYQILTSYSITANTYDLTAGSSALKEGRMYLMYS